MSTDELTLDVVRKAAKQVVFGKPDGFKYADSNSTYSRCYYMPRPDIYQDDDLRAHTGCLVGEILKVVGRQVTHPEQRCSARFLPELKYVADAGVVTYLELLQEKQDRGVTWQKALEYAEEYAGRLL